MGHCEFPGAEDFDFSKVYDFARFFCQEDMTCTIPDFHREMYQLAQDGHKRIVICAPRSFAKSTVFSKIYPLYMALSTKIKRIVLLSATGDLAEEMLKWIKKQLEDNEMLKLRYGGQPGSKWTVDHLEWVRPDRSIVDIEARGAGKQVRGKRIGLIVCDDLEEDEGVLSEYRRAKMLDWYNKAVINTLDADCQLIFIGTMIHPLCLLANVMSREMYESRKYEAYISDGVSLWPERWPVLALIEREKEIGHAAFMSEFMNSPIISENPIFVREWFNEYDSGGEHFKKIQKEGLYTVSAIDPAISRKESSDFSAIVTVSATFDKEPKFYVRVGGVLRGHWPISKQVSELDRISRDMKANLVAIETVAYQQALADEFRAYTEKHRYFPNIKEIKPDRDKERRAHAITGPLTRGQVFFDHTDPMTQRLMDEMFLFPTGDKDDLTDAFVYAMSLCMRWAKRRDPHDQTGPHIVLPRRRRNSITGVV